MKKILAGLTLAVLLGAVVVPVALADNAPVQATQCTMTHDFKTDTTWASQYGINCAAKGNACLFSDSTLTCGACCLMNTIYTITDWIFIIIVILVVIFILFGAFNILTAGGSPEKVNSGRSYIIYAVVGMIIALIAKLIPMIARSIVGM